MMIRPWSNYRRSSLGWLMSGPRCRAVPMPEHDDADVLHLWRVVSVTFGGPIEATYECELHPGEHLEVPPGGVHPAEC